MYHIVKHFMTYLFYICYVYVLYLYIIKSISLWRIVIIMITNKKFGTQIKAIRENKHFTVRQTALQGGFSSAYLSQIENGKKNIPKVATLYKIAKGLRISQDDILILAGITHIEDVSTDTNVDLGEQLENNSLLLSFEGKELSPEYRQAILSILKTLPDADHNS
jgi:HTH-type transcriptional regulator, competence development regulator